MEENLLAAPTEASIINWLEQPKLAKSGHFFTPSDDIWRPDISQASINVGSVKSSVLDRWQPWLVAALAYYLRQKAQNTVNGVAYCLRACISEGLSPLNDLDLIRIRERLSSSHFSVVAAFVEFWSQCEDLPIRPDRKLIEAYKDLPRKKKAGRDVVASLDPLRGPFTPYERDVLFQWICAAFASGRLALDRFVYLRLLFVYGARKVNIQQMVFGDIHRTTDGHPKIRLPKAKGRGEEGGYRKELVTFGLSKDLYLLFSGYKRYVLERLKSEYPGRADWDIAINNVPLFRRVGMQHGSFGYGPIIIDSEALNGIEVAPNSQLHAPADTLKSGLEAIRGAEDFPISERTGDKIHVHSHRFRHTIGTDMAAEGYSAEAIAAALTHKNTRATGKYIKTSIKMARRIDEKLKDHLALVVNAFTGVIVGNRHEAHNGEREDRQLRNLAVCGADSQCYMDAPLACYPCPKFQPLLHADHHRALEELEARQEMSMGVDQNTAAVYDRSILACRRVIHECQQILNSAPRPNSEDEV
ncbi:tyrosine-type recombinase/integrase [Teredinibacter turnerae]|uniref:tyrosine-type recombinase/integrase n=1 Tax=Teredinibacter turnerae TaxID=2426 RepID=UPI0003809252|nr:tyrosine-type recombinase/integrase [Teredinibacter turnerae]